jgi:hypothetical protein
MITFEETGVYGDDWVVCVHTDIEHHWQPGIVEPCDRRNFDEDLFLQWVDVVAAWPADSDKEEDGYVAVDHASPRPLG